ncbi:MAG: carbohydrate ABC transporter permease [Thermoproteus sp.]
MRARAVIYTLLAAVVGVGWLFPLIATAMGSITPYETTVLYGWWSFKSLTGANYADLIREHIYVYVLNSLAIAGASTALPIVVGMALAFSIRRRHIPGGEIWAPVLYILQVLPQQSVTVPVLSLYNRAQWIMQSYLGVVLVHTAFALPWITFFFYNFLASLPKELIESAEIDGASDFRLFYNVVLPVMTTAIISVAAIQFVFVYNDLYFGLVFIRNRNLFPVTVFVANSVSAFFVNVALMAAAAVVAIVPPIIIFLALQRYYVTGILGGFMKG